MGLDMYLIASSYSSSCSYSSARKNEVNFPKELEQFKEDFNYCRKEYSIGHWRKFNALHSFIVNEFANGEDKCQKIYLRDKDIERILKVLKEVKESFKNAKIIKQEDDYIVYDNPMAKELLPTERSFFLGSLEYDSYYLKDIDYSINLFEKVLKLVKEYPNYDIYYRASWQGKN